MSTYNQRKQVPAFPLFATIIGVAIAVCVVSFFVKALFVRHQVIQDGERIKRLERSLAEYTAKNESLLAKKNELISVTALQHALATKVLNLRKIDERFVVTVLPLQTPTVAVASGVEAR